MKLKWYQILKWILLFAYLIVISGFTSNKQNSIICQHYEIIIIGQDKFITEEIVEKMLIINNIVLDSCVVDNLNFDEVENILASHPAVLRADAYKDFSGNIYIKLTQRKPVFRVITKDNYSYYIDSRAEIMTLSEIYTSHVPVVSGHINELFTETYYKPELINSQAYPYDFTIRDMYDFVDYLSKHDLWKYQITQIYINKNYQIELIPRLGHYTIILGKLDNYNYKLNKLEALYRSAFDEIYRNDYSAIDLRYSDQVILKKRI